MPHFVIAGKANCPLFVHAIRIAHYLSDHLPEIDIKKQEFLDEEWNKFLLEINQANSWYVTKSPLIWKEIAFAGGKPHLIGGLSEFWEYIDDYYGAKTFLNKQAVEQMCLENLEAYHNKNSASIEEAAKSSAIGIFGFNNNYAQMLLPELFDVPDLFRNKVIIRIYDPESLRDILVEDDVMEVIEGYRNGILSKVCYELVFCMTLSDFVRSSDVILITEDYSQEDSEDRSSWLKRCSVEMFELANEINDVGMPHLKIICCHLGPTCFTATTLTKYVSPLRQHNIVAVTAQEGLKALNSVSKLTGIPTASLGAPPVWGFVGLDQFVDVQGIIVMQNFITPYRRAIKNIVGSTLPQKKTTKQLRFLSCTVDPKDVMNDMIIRCNLYNKLERSSSLPLLRATLHLLKLWFCPRQNSDEIISLGIFSTGTFGIPNKIVFSQPVTLNDKKVWTPYENIPILNRSRNEIRKCVEFTEGLILMIRDCF
ncbi:hypothetical protein HHI36_012969 [Cryptolaemus montrouzieri]|uniref:Lactate/malate dehydrogenase C-terminal domain-containing protein n=1 Tax=Cryptolaemus montrouzieri TaxID=559131 RepID=A0ABD2NG45_9CUCU